MVKEIVAGGVSGTVSCLLLQPLDVYKTRLQERTTSTLRLKELWRGTTATLLRNVPGTALYFSILAHLKYRAVVLGHRYTGAEFLLNSQDRGRLSHAGNAAAGGAARALAGLCCMPFTVLKVRFESAQFTSIQRMSAMARKVWELEGPRGLFRGFWVTVARDAPHAALYVAVFEAIRERRGNGSLVIGGGGNSLWRNASAGLIAGAFATIATQPFDTIKTRYQLDSSTTVFKTISSVVRSEGLLGLYRGTAPRFMRKTLSSAITWAIYEELAKKAD